MAVSVFPERMNKLDPEDVNTSLRTIENYISYITERTEYALTNTFRTTTNLGGVSKEAALALEELSDNIRAFEDDTRSALTNKVDKVDGMGLSHNDYTDAEKSKLDNIEADAEVNVIETVKKNGTALPVTDKAVNVTVPTAVSELTNDSGYQNAQQVQAAVSAGLAFLLISATYGPAAMVSFSSETEGLPLKKCQADIAPVQAGSGDPSPSNVRAISGWTGLHLHVSPTEDASDGKTYTVDWTDEAGTVYGGTLDVLAGTLTVDRLGKVFDGTEVWTLAGSGTQRLYRYVDNRGRAVVGDRASSHFLNANITTSSTAVGYYAYTSGNRTDTYVQFRPGLDVATTTDEWKAWLAEQAQGGTPLVCWWVTRDPVTYQLTPQTVTTLAGANHIWADCGDITVEYGAILAALQSEIEKLQEGGT